jgi:hypothetical protein
VTLIAIKATIEATDSHHGTRNVVLTQKEILHQAPRRVLESQESFTLTHDNLSESLAPKRFTLESTLEMRRFDLEQTDRVDRDTSKRRGLLDLGRLPQVCIREARANFEEPEVPLVLWWALARTDRIRTLRAAWRDSDGKHTAQQKVVMR